MSAPNRLHTYRNDGSVTSSIGARNSGLSPKSMSAIRIGCILTAKIAIFVLILKSRNRKS